eukprot:403340926
MCCDTRKDYVNLLPSSDGQIGPGIYLTTLVEAFKIADYKGDKDGSVVLKVAVNLGKVFENSNSSVAIHERWAGIDYPFGDWVVKINNKLRVIDVWLISGTLTSKLIVPAANFYLMSSFNLNNQLLQAVSVVKNVNVQDLYTGAVHVNVSSPGGSVQQSTEVKFAKADDILFFPKDEIGQILRYSGFVQLIQNVLMIYRYEGSKLAHKEGTLYHCGKLFEANKDKLYYQGQFKDGLMHGKGIRYYKGYECEVKYKYGQITEKKNYKYKQPNGEIVIYTGDQIEQIENQYNNGQNASWLGLALLQRWHCLCWIIQ